MPIPYTSRSQAEAAAKAQYDIGTYALSDWIADGRTIDYGTRAFEIYGYNEIGSVANLLTRPVGSSSSSSSTIITAVSPSIVASVNTIANDYEALNTRLLAQESKAFGSSEANVKYIPLSTPRAAPAESVIPAEITALDATLYGGDNFARILFTDLFGLYTSDGASTWSEVLPRQSVVPDSVTAIDSRVAIAEAESKSIKQEIRRTTTQSSGSVGAHTKYPFEAKDSITNAMLFDANNDYVRKPFDTNGHEWWTLGGLGDNTKYPYDPDLAPFFLEWTTVAGYEPIVRLARCQYMATNGITLAQLQVEPAGDVVGDIVAGWMKLEDLV